MRFAAFAVLALSAVLAGCATGPLESPQPTLADLQAARNGGIPPLNVGEFKLAPGKPQSMDRVIVARAGTASPPEGKSFAKYLGSTLEATLKAAGKLDPNSPVTVQGLLGQSELNTNMPHGHAALGATFIAVKNGQEVYHKDLSVDSSFDSAFIGAIAIPAAFNEYAALYARLVDKLLGDPDFQAAVTR